MGPPIPESRVNPIHRQDGADDTGGLKKLLIEGDAAAVAVDGEIWPNTPFMVLEVSRATTGLS